MFELLLKRLHHVSSYRRNSFASSTNGAYFIGDMMAERVGFVPSRDERSASRDA